MLKRLRKEKRDTFLSVDEILEEMRRLAENDLYYNNLYKMIKDMEETNKEAYNAIKEQIETYPIQDKLDILLYL